MTRGRVNATIDDVLHAETLSSIMVMRVLRNLDLATTSQIQYWDEYGWIKSENAHIREARRIYTQHQFRKIWFLAYLVNRVGLRAAKAHHFAEILAKQSIEDLRPMIWITYKSMTVGIPNVLAEALNGNPSH